MPVLVDAARRRARDTPDAPLIDAPAERRVVTAGELGADACATAAALRQPRHRSRARGRGARRQPQRLFLAAPRVPRRRGGAAADRWQRPRGRSGRRGVAVRGVGAGRAGRPRGRRGARPAGGAAPRPPRRSVAADRAHRRRAGRHAEAHLGIDGRAEVDRHDRGPDRRRRARPHRDHGHPARRLAGRRDSGVALVRARQHRRAAAAAGHAGRAARRLRAGADPRRRGARRCTPLRRRAVHVRSAGGAAPRRLAMAGHAADDDLGRRAARSRDGAGLRRTHRPAHPLALRDERDGRHRLRHRPRSRRRRDDGPPRAGRDARVLA